MWERQGGGQRGPPSPSVHLLLLAVEQLSLWHWPRLQGGRLLLLHRFAPIGTVFLDLCKASPGPLAGRAEGSGALPSRSSVPVLCSFSSGSGLRSILTAPRKPMESSASRRPPRLPPASCRENTVSGRHRGDSTGIGPDTDLIAAQQADAG